MESSDPKANVYITNLPETITEDALRAIFLSYGNIVRMRIASNPLTGQKAGGYAFVQFEFPESAQKAISATNGLEIDKRKLKVSLAKTKGSVDDSKEPKTNIYIAGLPLSYSKIELDTIFSAYGTITGSRVMMTPTGDSKGVGFVRYATPESAQKAIEAVNGTVPAGFKDPLNVSFAKERVQDGTKASFFNPIPRGLPVPYNPYGVFTTPVTSVTADAANLYIVGLPESFSKLELDGLFAPYGRVLNSRILKTPAGTTKGVSLVRLDTQEGAIAAIQALHGQVPPKGTEPIQVKLAKNQSLQVKTPQVTPSINLSPEVYGAVKTSAVNFRYNPISRPPVPTGFDPNLKLQYQPTVTQPSPYQTQRPQGFQNIGQEFNGTLY